MKLIELKDIAISTSRKAGDYLNSQKGSAKEIISEIIDNILSREIISIS